MISKEASNYITKVASARAIGLVEDERAMYEINKVAEEIVAKMSPVEMSKYAEAEAFGRGKAAGYMEYAMMDKTAEYNDVAEGVYKAIIDDIGKLYGVKVAEEIHENLVALSGDNPEVEDEIKEEGARAAAEILMEAHGGQEVVLADENLKQSLLSQAEAIGEAVKDELVEEAKKDPTGGQPAPVAPTAPAAGVVPQAAPYDTV